jgi:outer membrane biosynthesis protein TonB
MRTILSRGGVFALVLAFSLGNAVFAKPTPAAKGDSGAPKPAATSFPLTGTWLDSALNEVHVSQSGSHMTMMPKGHVYNGKYALDTFIVTRPFHGSEVKNAPSDVQGRVDAMNLKVTLTGTVSSDGNTITLTEKKPNKIVWDENHKITGSGYGETSATLRRNPPLTPAPKATPTAAEPSEAPTKKASPKPKSSSKPSASPKASSKPSAKPTPKPTKKPTPNPTKKPAPKPTKKPTPKPTAKPTPKATATPKFVPCHPNSGAVASIGPCTGKPGTPLTFKLSRALKSPPAQLVFYTVVQNGVPAQVIVKITGGTPPYYTVSAPAQLCVGASKTWNIRLIDAAGKSQGDIGTFMPDCRGVPNPKRT